MIKTYLFTEKETKEDVPLDKWTSLVKGDCKLLWVDVRSANEDELNQLAQWFNLHSVAIESCLDGYRRPHLYEFENHFYVNLTTIQEGPNDGLIEGELHLFAGDKFVLTVSKAADCEPVERALDEYKTTPGLCAKGTLYAVYLLAEDLVESYFPIIEDQDDAADELEADMLENATMERLQKLFALKRKGFELRRLLGPQRDIFNGLVRRDFPFITGENRAYFQDVYNRMIRLFDMMDTVREILSNTLDIYLSAASNRTNQIVKVLTIVATVFLTLSFITSFYGMNFIHLPYLSSPNAFRNISIIMAGIIVIMLIWFRRKGWL